MATQHPLVSGAGPTRSRQRIACVLLEKRGDATAFAEACFRFSPQIALRTVSRDLESRNECHEAVFIEIGASRALFSEASIEARLKALSRRFLKSSITVAISDTAA